MPKWDYYSCSTDAPVDLVVSALLAGVELSSVRPGRAMHGYANGLELHRGDRVMSRIWWGQNPGVHIQSSGDNAPDVAPVLKASLPGHRCTRVDAAEDWDEPGLYDRMAGEFIRIAKKRGLALDFMGDWERGIARTLYVGTQQSTVQVCLYEKGYEQGCGASLKWVRLEVRVRPEKRPQRVEVGAWDDPQLAFGAAGWLREVLGNLGWEKLKASAIAKPWRASEAERARYAMVRTYGSTLACWAQEAGGWDKLGDVIKAASEQQQAERQSQAEAVAGRVNLKPTVINCGPGGAEASDAAKVRDD